MPLNEEELRQSQRIVHTMFDDTIRTFLAIRHQSELLFGHRANEIRAAIDECMNDFVFASGGSGEKHPEVLIFSASAASFQRAGFYGAQLELKRRQVTDANSSLREALASGMASIWKAPFKKWIDVINNFLGSLAAATGLAEAIKELKDCLRDEVPE